MIIIYDSTLVALIDTILLLLRYEGRVASVRADCKILEFIIEKRKNRQAINKSSE